MTAEIISEQWYTTLVEDCKDIATETEFTHRWALVEGRHMLGKRILEEYENFQRLRMPDSELVQRIAISISRQKRTVYYCIQFARKYPDLNMLEEGKNTSWHHIINKYLTDGEEKLVKISPTEQIKQIKQLLEHEWEEANQYSVEDGTLKEAWLGRKEFIRYLQDQVEKITGG